MVSEIQMKKDKTRLKRLLRAYRDEMITNITRDNDLAYLNVERIDKAIELIIFSLKRRY